LGTDYGGDYSIPTETAATTNAASTTPADANANIPTASKTEATSDLSEGWTSAGSGDGSTSTSYYSPELGDPTITIKDTAGTDYTNLLPTGWDAYGYKKANTDIDWDSGIDPLEHYLNTGKAKGLGWGTTNKYSPTYDPDYQYSWQSDQDWAVPGRQKDTSYNVNVGSGDSVATDDPYETQRDESGKPTTSNYKYYETG